MTDEKELLDGLSSVIRGRIVLSGILNEPDKVEVLRTMTAESRMRVLTAHASLGVAWDEAVKQGEYEEEDTENEGTEDDRNPNQLPQRWRLDALKPHPLNSKLYGLSLGPERIKDLAEDIKEKGQRVPIEILADGTMLDGHSRYLAKQLLGHDMVWVVIVADNMTEPQILRYIIDANRSQRRMSVREQVMVFQAELELTRLGDPQNEDPAVNLDLDPQNEDRPSAKNIRDEAARRAGFRSYETARRARKVFSDADDGTKTQLDLGEISVNRAYATLTAASGDDRMNGTSTQTSGDAETEEVRFEEPAETEDEESDSADSVAVDRDETGGIGSSGPGEGLEDEGVPGNPSEDQATSEDIDDTKNVNEGDSTESAKEDISVDEALEVLAQHLEELVAEAGIKAAKAEVQVWLTWLFERAKAARDMAA